MMAESKEQIYLCPKCLKAQDMPGVCPRDGTELLTCQPGHPDDPCRRPLIDAKGRVVSRAPIWWLRYTVRNLINHLEDLTSS
jgi:hypothetical protein